MLSKPAPPDSPPTCAADEIRDPLVFEFLGLKGEYSESDLEEALIRHLEHFLLELGGDFAFVARQRRIDLLFYHRRLRCLVVIDLKQGELAAADAREHWTHLDENPPVGLILASAKDEAVARYALDGLEDAILAREYRLALPDEKTLEKEITKLRTKVAE